MRALVAAVLFASGAAHAADDAACPILSRANDRLQARVDHLHGVSQGLFAEDARAFAVPPDLAIALASVIVARAKEEARIWLVEKLSNEICDKRRATIAGYFPNTCAALPAEGRYPGPSLTQLRTRLREDIYALPACYLHRRPPNPDFESPASDTEIDPYVVEALLVAAYAFYKRDDADRVHAPALSSSLSEEDVARLLIVTLLAEKEPWKWRPACESHDQGACQSLAKAVALYKDTRDLVKRATATTPEQVVRRLLAYLDVEHAGRAQELRAVASAYFAALRGNYADAGLEAASNLLCGGEVDLPTLCARMPLLGAIASAESREDMEAALDSAISPLGSWKRKQSERVVSLNAMAGIAGGYERLKDGSDDATHGTAGLYLPIAVEYSRPVDVLWFRSLALGASFLDLGGLVSYGEEDELLGGETTSSSNSSWSSVTSPGVYVAGAFEGSPFRLGLSWSRTPGLRSVDLGGGVVQDLDSDRLMLFLAVDVTLLGF